MRFNHLDKGKALAVRPEDRKPEPRKSEESKLGNKTDRKMAILSHVIRKAASIMKDDVNI